MGKEDFLREEGGSDGERGRVSKVMEQCKQRHQEGVEVWGDGERWGGTLRKDLAHRRHSTDFLRKEGGARGRRERGEGRELLSEAGHPPLALGLTAAEARPLGSRMAGPRFPSSHPGLARKYEAEA